MVGLKWVFGCDDVLWIGFGYFTLVNSKWQSFWSGLVYSVLKTCFWINIFLLRNGGSSSSSEFRDGVGQWMFWSVIFVGVILLQVMKGKVSIRVNKLNPTSYHDMVFDQYYSYELWLVQISSKLDFVHQLG